MKEERYFYVPQAGQRDTLPDDEAQHALKVLRLKEGAEIFLMDGEGTFFRAEVTLATNHVCQYHIIETLPQQRPWRGSITIAMAPTKMMDRIEWFAEKATEIGFDELSFLDCRLSERRQLRIDRIETKVVGAVKQSRKAWMPKVNDICDFKDFILSHNPETKEADGLSECWLCETECPYKTEETAIPLYLAVFVAMERKGCFLEFLVEEFVKRFHR